MSSFQSTLKKGKAIIISKLEKPIFLKKYLKRKIMSTDSNANSSVNEIQMFPYKEMS